MESIVLTSAGIKVKHKNSKRATKVFLTMKEKRTLMSTFNDATCILMEYYVDLTKRTNPVYDDVNVAKALGWKQAKVKRLRIALTKADYFYSIKEGRIKVTYLFPEAVAKAKNMSNNTLSIVDIDGSKINIVPIDDYQDDYCTDDKLIGE